MGNTGLRRGRRLVYGARMTRARIRLPREVYQSPHAVSVTICARGRRLVFSHSALARDCIALLYDMAQATDVPVYAYCLMPDHAHLLLSTSGKNDVVDFVGQWKGLTTRLSWQRGLQGSWWQRRFYDHVLRDDESLQDCARYILNNPVRAGLAETWREYPFSGSLIFDDL